MKAWAVIRNEQPLQCHSDLHFWHGSYDMGGGTVMTATTRDEHHRIVDRLSLGDPAAARAAVVAHNEANRQGLFDALSRSNEFSAIHL